jgi:hypothetical protein
MQADTEVAPCAEELVPAAQSVQDAAPAALHLPAGQARQAADEVEAALGSYEPAGQLTQAAAPASE